MLTVTHSVKRNQRLLLNRNLVVLVNLDSNLNQKQSKVKSNLIFTLKILMRVLRALEQFQSQSVSLKTYFKLRQRPSKNQVTLNNLKKRVSQWAMVKNSHLAKNVITWTPSLRSQSMRNKLKDRSRPLSQLRTIKSQAPVRVAVLKYQERMSSQV
jgi:hypothetical protein